MKKEGLPNSFKFWGGYEGLYPMPLDNEIARITTRDNSGRDAGGCVAPTVSGLVVVKMDDEGYAVGEFSFSSSRVWGREPWPNHCESEIRNWRIYSDLPVFVWRNTNSAYHMDWDSATAEVEVVPSPTPEWLEAEMDATGLPWRDINLKDGAAGAGQSSMAAYTLRLYRELFFAVKEDEEDVEHLPARKGTVWSERATMDIRALAIRAAVEGFMRTSWASKYIVFHRWWRGVNSWMLEEFTDPRPPVVKAAGGSFQIWHRGKIVATTVSPIGVNIHKEKNKKY